MKGRVVIGARVSLVQWQQVSTDAQCGMHSVCSVRELCSLGVCTPLEGLLCWVTMGICNSKGYSLDRIQAVLGWPCLHRSVLRDVRGEFSNPHGCTSRGMQLCSNAENLLVSWSQQLTVGPFPCDHCRWPSSSLSGTATSTSPSSCDTCSPCFSASACSLPSM